MLNRIGYVLRETGASLARNKTLTMAAVLTAAVSLLLGGLALLVQRGVGNFLVQWKGGVEFIVFMNPEATPELEDGVRQALQDNPQVSSARYIDKAQAYEELKRLYPDSPALIESVTPEDMPTSFRVVPETEDADVIEAVANQMRALPGVFSVELAKDYVQAVQNISGVVRVVSYAAAAVLLGIAVILIWNTIRTAIFARRREIEVMKLVGATNWFIRVPFMLEGLLHGLLGGLIAVAGLRFVDWLWGDRALSTIRGLNLEALQATTDQFRLVALTVLGVGMIVGAIGSAIAATRFLDV